MVRVVVADASPLIVLARIGQIELLARTCGQVIVPHAVRAECLVDPRRPGARAIGQAFDAGWLLAQPAHPQYEPVDVAGLNAGEAAAIGLAEALQCPVLIDERLGRAAAARRNLAVIGTLGVLLRAKQQGLAPAVGPLVQAIKNQGYFLSPAVEREIVRRAGEAAAAS